MIIPTMPMMGPTGIPMDNAALHRLLAWMSPSFPVGAFTYSHGMEWEVEQGTITDLETLVRWVEGILKFGAGRTDGLLLRRAHSEDEPLQDLNALALALSPTKERRLETSAQGTAFLKTALDAWDWEGSAPVRDALQPEAAYPIAVGAVAAGHGIEVEPVLHAYLHAMAANLISAGVRVIPLGQTDGQRALNRLGEVIEPLAEELLAADPDDIGGLSFLADIASAKHETQYTRLFRS